MDGIKAKKYMDCKIACLIWAGGLLTAIFLPAILAVVGFVIPFGNPATLTFLLKLIDKVEIKIALFFIMVLSIWYGLDVLLNILSKNRVKIRHGKLLFYGLAFAWSAHIGYVLFILESGQ